MIAERKATALKIPRAQKRVKNPELRTTTRRVVVAVDATSAGVRSTLHTGTVVCVRAMSTRPKTVRGVKLKRAQCWEN